MANVLSIVAIAIALFVWARPRIPRELMLDRLTLTDIAGNKTQIEAGIVAVSNGAIGACFVCVAGDVPRVVVESGNGVARLSASEQGPALVMQDGYELAIVQPSGISIDDGKSLAKLLPKKVFVDLASIRNGAEVSAASAFHPRITSKQRRAGQEHIRIHAPDDADAISSPA